MFFSILFTFFLLFLFSFFFFFNDTATTEIYTLSLHDALPINRIMEELGPPHFDDADKDFAAKIRSTLTEKDIASVYYAIGMDPTDRPLADFLVPLNAKRNPLVGSTDVGDVSWVVPTVQVHAPTVAIGTPFHT